jgi:hypothetical protein
MVEIKKQTIIRGFGLIAFFSFVLFVYSAIWFQSIVFGEMALASVFFTLFFGWVLTKLKEEV